MSNRVKIKIELTKLDYFIEILGIITALLLVIIPLYYYNALPERIPKHFNFQGDPDATGPKWTLLILTVVGLALYLVMTILNKFPHTFNYMVTITEENAYIQYKYACRLIRIMKVSILFIFFYISSMNVLIALGRFQSLSKYFLPTMLLLVFVPIVYYLVLSVRKK